MNNLYKALDINQLYTKLPMKYDVERLQGEVFSLSLKGYIYYDVIPLRAPAHTLAPSLPFPPPADDYADGSWCDWLNSQVLHDLPYIKQIVEEISNHTKVNLVRILRLAPGAVVKEHTDPTLGLEVDRSVIRLTIPIVNEDGVQFILDGKVVPMKPGECWYMQLTKPHSVINNSNADRINLTIDVIPNAWLMSQIEQGNLYLRNSTTTNEI